MTPDQIEKLLLRAVLDDLKEGGSHPLSTPMRSRCGLARRLREATGLPTSTITRFLDIPRSTYYYHLARAGRDRDAGVRGAVRDAFERCGWRGYRAMWAQLRRDGVRVSEKVVRRAMRELGLSPRRRSRRRWSSYAGEASPAPPNLPLREDGSHDFRAAAPNELWVTDITEFRVPSGGKCYLSPVIDCFDGRPVAWSIGALAGLDRDLRARRADPQHVAQGDERRQRPRRGVLRPAQAGVLLRRRLDRSVPGGLHGGAGRLDALVPRGPHLPGARLAYPRRAPGRDGVRGVGLSKKMSAVPFEPSARRVWGLLPVLRVYSVNNLLARSGQKPVALIIRRDLGGV